MICLYSLLECSFTARSTFSARENFKTVVGDILQLTNVDTNSAINFDRAMRIGNCTTASNRQWGACQVFFNRISISSDASTGTRIIGIPLAAASGHYVFLTNSFVVFGFENVRIRSTNVVGLIISSNGSTQSFQPTAEERATAKRILGSSLNQQAFMCSVREHLPLFSSISIGQ